MSEFKPMPDDVELHISSIHGYGVFAKHDIPKGKILGLARIKVSWAEHGFVRTPLGGYINHSEDPNCLVKELSEGVFYLITNSDISKSDELTVKYVLYDVNK